MATSLRILGWKAENLRCPDHEVTFTREEDETYPISLIQMPNGTGKTTTLELLRATLSGEAQNPEWTSEKIGSFKKRDATSGEFRVTLLHDMRRLTVSLRFDFVEGSVRYQTTRGSSGLEEGFHPPPALRNFLRRDFVRFFIFDGEFAHRLLDHDYANAQSVVEELFQLQHLSSMAHEVERYWEQKTRHAATEERGLSRRRNRVVALRERIASLKSEREREREQLARIKNNLSRQRKKFQTAIDANQDLARRLSDAEITLAESSRAVESATQNLWSDFKNPAALAAVFGRDLMEFKASLDRAKLPESTAREFFEELAQENFCVCGVALDDDRRMLIRDRASNYLGSDDVALLNAIKSDISDLVGGDPALHEFRLVRLLEQLQARVADENVARTARDAIQTEGVGEDPGLKKAQEGIRALEEQLRIVESRLERYEDRDDSSSDENTFGIAVLERRLNDAEKKLAEITDTLLLKRKRDVLSNLLRRARENARIRLSAELTDQANRNFATLMPNNDLRIREVNRSLVLEEKSGASVGETLAVAYSFISTLLSRGGVQLPFVIDSPANPIDLKVRPKVAALVPHLSQQFIAFVISSERQGFVSSLEKVARNGLQHITVFRKGVPELDRVARKEKHVADTADGMCVYGKSFFHSFHTDEE